MSARLAIAAIPRPIRAALDGEELGQFDCEYHRVMAAATGTPGLSGVLAMLERWLRVAWSASDDPAAHAHMLAAAARLNAGEDVPVMPWQQLRATVTDTRLRPWPGSR
jgi:DNA-binding FadR family transcriptional regulator